VKYFNFPKSWEDDQNIPKEVIYKVLNADTKTKEFISETIKKSRKKYTLNFENTGIEQNEIIDEINFIYIELKKRGKEEKIIRLFHNLIPRQTVLILASDNKTMISVAIKSIDKVVKIEKIYNTDWFEEEKENSFLETLDMKHYNAMNLKTFYESILDRVKTYKVFGGNVKKENIQTKDLDEMIRLKEELEEIEIKMKKETQLNRRVELGKRRREIMEKLEK